MCAVLWELPVSPGAGCGDIPAFPARFSPRNERAVGREVGRSRKLRWFSVVGGAGFISQGAGRKELFL